MNSTCSSAQIPGDGMAAEVLQVGFRVPAEIPLPMGNHGGPATAARFTGNVPARVRGRSTA